MKRPAGVVGILLFVACGPTSQQFAPIADNGQPLYLRITRVAATRDSQTSEVFATSVAPHVLAGRGSPGPGAVGLVRDTLHVPLALGPSESFLVVDFSVLNVERRLQLAAADVQLIDRSGVAHDPLGCASPQEGAWIPVETERLQPSEGRVPDMSFRWLFRVPTDAVTGAVVRFRGVTVPLFVGAVASPTSSRTGMRLWLCHGENRPGRDGGG